MRDAPPNDDRPVASPCVSVCVLDPAGTGVCVGCGRTLDEVAAWSELSNAQRREVVARLPARLAALRERNRARHWDANPGDANPGDMNGGDVNAGDDSAGDDRAPDDDAKR